MGNGVSVQRSTLKLRKQHTSKKEKKRGSIDTVEVSYDGGGVTRSSKKEASPAMECARGYLMGHTKGEFKRCGERYCTPRFIVEFVGSEDDGETNTEMPGDQFHSCEEDILAAFPDFTVRWESLTEVRPGEIFVKGIGASGTNTGSPYAFGPFPPIPATGVHVSDPPLEATMYIDEDSGKMYRFKINSFGQSSGPANFYTKIGGIVM